MRYLNIFHYDNESLVVRAYNTRSAAEIDSNAEIDLIEDNSVDISNYPSEQVEALKRRMIIAAAHEAEFEIVLDMTFKD